MFYVHEWPITSRECAIWPAVVSECGVLLPAAVTLAAAAAAAAISDVAESTCRILLRSGLLQILDSICVGHSAHDGALSYRVDRPSRSRADQCQ